MRSPYTLDNPPPDDPPGGVLVPSLWRVQARWWKRHTPALEHRAAKRPVCAHCRQTWPCHSWACWDGQLGEAIAAPGLAAGPDGDRSPAPVSHMPEPSLVRARAVRYAVAHAQKSAA